MYKLKVICLTIVELVKQAWLLPQTIALAVQQRRQQLTRRQFETERLDRISNPSKYRGMSAKLSASLQPQIDAAAFGTGASGRLRDSLRFDLPGLKKVCS